MEDSDSPDWAVLASGRDQPTVSEDECADLRRRLIGSTERLTELADGEYSDYSRSQLSRHANGRCAHDHGVCPVTSVRRWEYKDER